MKGARSRVRTTPAGEGNAVSGSDGLDSDTLCINGERGWWRQRGRVRLTMVVVVGDDYGDNQGGVESSSWRCGYALILVRGERTDLDPI